MNLGSVLNSTTLLDASGLANWTVALVALSPALSRGLGRVTDSPRTGNGKRAKKRKATSEIVHTGRIANARSRTGANPQGVSEEEERSTEAEGQKSRAYVIQPARAQPEKNIISASRSVFLLLPQALTPHLAPSTQPFAPGSCVLPLRDPSLLQFSSSVGTPRSWVSAGPSPCSRLFLLTPTRSVPVDYPPVSALVFWPGG
jgi:hypothetical protein